MTWGTFGVCHVASLILAIGIIVGLYFLLRNRSDKVKTAVLGVLSFSGIAAILFNLLAWGTPLEYLPLHLCSLNAMVLPIAVFTRNKTLNNLLLLWSIGAFFALVINTSVAGAKILSWTFVFYYFPHVLEMGIPILMFLLGLVKKDPRCILSTVGITLGAYTVIHFINLGVNHLAAAHSIKNPAGEIVSVNYMYSIRPENPLLDLFYRLIPHAYWYMFLCVIVVVVYLGLVYLNDFIRMARAKKRA